MLLLILTTLPLRRRRRLLHLRPIRWCRHGRHCADYLGCSWL